MTSGRSYSSKDVIRRLEDEGWDLVGNNGSHHQFKHPNRPGRVTIAHPVRDIPVGTLRSIFRQAGWDWNQR
jgi:predicted RNA binding protein YcfA (HicA-like mRNA interferase family)